MFDDTQTMEQSHSLPPSSNGASKTYAPSRQQLDLASALNNVGTLLYKRGEDSAAIVLYHHSLASVGVQARGLQCSRLQLEHAILRAEKPAERSRLLSLPAKQRATEMSQLFASLEQKVVDMPVPPIPIPMTYDQNCEIGMENVSTEPITIKSGFACCATNGTEPEMVGDQSFKTLYNMGLVKSKTGDISQAKQLYEQGLARIASREEYLLVGLLCLHHLGRIHYTKERYGEALYCFSRVISEGQERVANLQSEASSLSAVTYCHQLVASAMVCISKTFMEMQELEGSLACCHEALSLRRAALVSDNMGFATVKFVVGLVHHNQGEMVNARTHYDQYLRQALADLGALHPRVATAQQKIGEVLLEEGLNHEALEYFRKAFGARSQVFGENNADVGRTIFCIGRTYHELDNYVDALTLYKKALAIEEACIKDDSQIVNILCNIGQVHHLNGELNEALDTYRRAMSYPFNEHMPFILRQVGCILVEKREARTAMAFFMKAQRIIDAFEVKNDDDDSTRLALLLSLHNYQLPGAPAA